mmetsp:Transcript_31548/g.60993  ORF Transcript_31548/g.60993 Transcript_31548/m.60993 type:complete len:94 (+) Transcript_31548:1100-1381(+)
MDLATYPCGCDCAASVARPFLLLQRDEDQDSLTPFCLKTLLVLLLNLNLSYCSSCRSGGMEVLILALSLLLQQSFPNMVHGGAAGTGAGRRPP